MVEGVRHLAVLCQSPLHHALRARSPSPFRGGFLAAALLFTAAPAQAYWNYGHETVAAIAWSQVTPIVRARIRSLIAHAPELATPECPIHNIEQASIWPDCIKKGERFSYAYPWHFQNIDICRPFDIKSNCAFGNCVSAQITRNEKLLKDRSVPPRERLMALAFLVHFVGDLHQPLHAAERADLGGGKVKARYGQAGGRINLHMIWDGYLAERAISTPPPGPRGLLSEIPASARAAAAAGTVEDWSRENWDVARDYAYAPVSGGDPCANRPEQVTLDNAKIEAAIPILRRQVARGGLRLARLLDEALG
ncbi:MAG: S1/P1 nuclease [Proteobacteria bacterium]|nr:S1/P1 nuclease [Pseudomonadota bacterium]